VRQVVPDLRLVPERIFLGFHAGVTNHYENQCQCDTKHVRLLQFVVFSLVSCRRQAAVKKSQSLTAVTALPACCHCSKAGVPLFGDPNSNEGHSRWFDPEY
jgi:hypothetical protein